MRVDPPTNVEHNKFDEEFEDENDFVDEPEDYDTYDLEMNSEDEEFVTMFASEGSALRAATKNNPRNQPCPTCDTKNVLTPEDVKLHYQCNRCADKDERGGGY